MIMNLRMVFSFSHREYAPTRPCLSKFTVRLRQKRAMRTHAMLSLTELHGFADVVRRSFIREMING